MHPFFSSPSQALGAAGTEAQTVASCLSDPSPVGSSPRSTGTLPEEERTVCQVSGIFINFPSTLWMPLSWDWLRHYKYLADHFNLPLYALEASSGGRGEQSYFQPRNPE